MVSNKHNTILLLVIIIIAVILIILVIGYFVRYQKKRVKNINTIVLEPCSSHEECKGAEGALYDVETKLRECAVEYANNYKVECPNFEVKESNSDSYTLSKQTIHIVLRKKNHTLYDEHTLLSVGLHELGHVLCRSNDCRTKSGDPHGVGYYLVLDRLIDIANNKYNYNATLNIDREYPVSS
jgi:hypothetical protein